MKMRRRAYALIEILTMIAAIVLLMALSAQPAQTALAEIPRMDRNYQAWIQTTDMLETLREDVENASAVRLAEHSDPNSYFLMLETSAGPVEYTLADGQAGRTHDGRTSTEWELPGSRLRVAAWSGNSGTYAVEVTTWVEQRSGSRVSKNFKQTHVFFRKAQ
jgi:hypothetical protein